MDRSVLVMGGTGQVGREVVRSLVRVGTPVRLASRTTRAPSSGVDVVPFDILRPDTFPFALEGVDRVFLIARPGDEEPDLAATSFVRALPSADVRHIVTLGSMGVAHREDIGLTRMERLVEETGIPFTHLRPNWFMQNFLGGHLLSSIRSRGCIAVPAALARVSFVDVRDVGGAAAVVLTDGIHKGRAYTITGPDAMTHDEVAAMLTTVTGRPIGYRNAYDSGADRPGSIPSLSLRYYELMRAGAFTPVSADVSRLLGCPARSFADFAREHASAWL